MLPHISALSLTSPHKGCRVGDSPQTPSPKSIQILDKQKYVSGKPARVKKFSTDPWLGQTLCFVSPVPVSWLHPENIDIRISMELYIKKNNIKFIKQNI